ncbi:TrkH family potassium uptake protein [Pelotomaculum propionicicum]|uniref:TrkH family potassium uptake protein n=1 Tax=Pelotomaculum propionicicum TaxID=258475 RepID=UPI003B77DBEC
MGIFDKDYYGISGMGAGKKRFVLRASPAQTLVLGFAAIILTGAILLTLPVSVQPGREIDFLTSLFTATSAVCVTGLVVVDTGTHWTTFGHIVILALIQVGGLGFMTMATFLYLLLGRRIGLKQRLIIQESMNYTSLSGIVRLARYVLLFTFVTELVFAAVLSLRWSYDLGWQKGLWFGLFHSVSAFNNAGFDLFGEFKSLTDYAGDATVTLCVTTLIILGGIGFSVIVDVVRRFKEPGHLLLHTKLVLSVSGFLIIAGTIMIYLLEYDNTLRGLSPLGKVLASYFQAVTPRTAGYNTLDMGALHSATQFLLVILMFIGASPGSTGGGIKTTTFGSLAVSVWCMIRGKENTEIFQRRIGQDQIYKSLAILLLAAGLVTFVTLLLSITEKADFLALLFETTSAFGTVGLTMGITPKLTTFGRILIILTMFLGRLGPLTLAFALARVKRKSQLRYPEEKIMVG